MTSLTVVNTCGLSMWLRIALWGTSLRGTLNDVSDVGQYLGLVTRGWGMAFEIRARSHILAESLQQT